jgi:hypothetical protein
MSTASLPSSPTDRQKIKGMLSEMTICQQRIDDQREAKKEIGDEIKRQFGLSTKAINKLVMTMHRRNYTDVKLENEEFEELYTTLIDSSVD